MTPITQDLSNKIANMGVVATFMIVCMHCPWSPNGWVENAIYKYSMAIWRIAVPAFFAISGYMLAGHTSDSHWYKNEVLKRVRSLCVPYFIWGGLGIAFTALLFMSLNIRCGREVLTGVRFGCMELFNDIGLNPVSLSSAVVAQLWYVRSLFVIVLISPLIKRCNSILFLVVVFVLYGAICPRGEDLSTIQAFFRIMLSLEGLFYFSVGFYLRDHSVSVNQTSAMSLLFIGLLGMAIFVIFHHLCVANWTYLIRWVSIPLVLVGVWSLVPTRPLPRSFSSGSFPGFLLHRFFILPFAMIGFPYRYCNDLTSSFLFVLFVWVMSVFVVPYVMRTCLSSRILSVLFGGR